MSKYKWLKEGIILIIVGSFITVFFSFVNDTRKSQIESDKVDVIYNLKIEQLQETDVNLESGINSNNEACDLIKQNMVTKDDLKEWKNEIKELIGWYHLESNKRYTEHTNSNFEDILGAENK